MQKLLTKGIGHTKFKKVKLSNLSQTKETSIPDDWLVKRIDEIGEKDPETIDESEYEYSEMKVYEYISLNELIELLIKLKGE